MNIVKDRSAQLVDARSASRFTAQEPEPRAGVRGGHMPGAINVHYRRLIAEDGISNPASVVHLGPVPRSVAAAGTGP